MKRISNETFLAILVITLILIPVIVAVLLYFSIPEYHWECGENQKEFDEYVERCFATDQNPYHCIYKGHYLFCERVEE